jgi:hypothetical protein
MKTKTTYEKEAERITKTVLQSLGQNFDKAFFENFDALAMVSFKPIADVLRRKRTEINGNFKAFCKSNGFPQYQIRYIEEGSIKNISLDLFIKYIRILEAEPEIKDWISKYPTIAKKYKISTAV